MPAFAEGLEIRAAQLHNDAGMVGAVLLLPPDHGKGGLNMKKHILCLGDSNTHGYCADPTDCADHGIRFNEEERWTCRLQKALGDEYLVTEEGLSGRTTVFVDPIHESMDALSVVYALLKSHEVIDLLIIMLGTNDVKERFGANAACIAAGMERLILKARAWTAGAPKPPTFLWWPRPASGTASTTPSWARAAWRNPPGWQSSSASSPSGRASLPGRCRLRVQSGGFHAPDPHGHAQLAEKLAALVPALV